MSIDSSTSGASPAKRPVISLKFLIVSLLLAVLAGGGFLGYIFWEEFSKHDPKAFRTEKLWREENPEEYKKMMEARGNRNGPPPSISGESGGGGGGGEGGGRRRGRPSSSSEESKDAPAMPPLNRRTHQRRSRYNSSRWRNSCRRTC